MNQKDKKLLYQLFRDHSDVLGTSKTTIMSLEAFVTAIKELKCPKSAIKEQIIELADAIKNSQPKIMPLIHLIEKFQKEMDQDKCFNKESCDDIKKVAIESLKKQIKLFKTNVRNVTTNGRTMIKNGDFIIVHSASSVIIDILVSAKMRSKKFKVLLLKQDFNKTKQTLKKLQKAKIDYTVIPEYNFVHYVEHVTKLFLGAITITSDDKLVCASGTSNVISLCHLHDVPSYLFVNSLKFSHKKSEDQNIHQKKVTKCHDDCEYCLETFSHDSVDLKLINHIVIGKGEIGIKDIPKYRH